MKPVKFMLRAPYSLCKFESAYKSIVGAYTVCMHACMAACYIL